MSLEDAEDRKALQSAVSAARVVLDQRGRDIEIFQHWKALTDAETEDSFAALPGVLQDLENALAAALDWHAKQTSDNKLRLKALAASFFIPATDLETAAKCPLCETNLTSDSQKALAGELESLKSEAAAAERKIDDACSDLRGRLDEALPQALTSRVDTLATMDPVASYEAAMLGRFADNPSYKDVLTGYVSSTRSLLAKQCEALPRLADAGKEDFPPEEPQATTDLRLTIAKVRRCIQLVNWWTEQRVAYASAWEALIGKTNEQGEWPDESLQGMVQRLETALADAEPLDKLATRRDAGPERV